MTETRIITIDGPAGVGKSTLARRLAAHLGIAYLDTGAMFRTVARELGQEGLDLSENELAERLAALEFSLAEVGTNTRLACNGIIAGQEIRGEDVGFLASRFAEKPAVRAFLKGAQQSLGRRFSLVAEGRDMGSAVFPGAPRKFFLDAVPAVRAKRRMRDLEAAGERPDLAALTEQIRRRDELDRNRAIAPLRPADDAFSIDTSTLDIEDVFSAIMIHIPAGWLPAKC